MAKKKTRAKDSKTYGYYLKVASLQDLARVSCAGSDGIYHITAIKQGRGFRLFAHGSRIGDTRVLYCFDVGTKDDVLVYDPNSERERCEFSKSNRAASEDYKSYKIPVLELSKNPYTVKAKLTSPVNIVRVKDVGSIARSIIADTSGRTDSVRMYVFKYKSAWVLGTFSLFRDGATKTFAYAPLDSWGLQGYLRYDYRSDSIEFCHGATEKAQIYIRIMNLAEPFPFFKEK